MSVGRQPANDALYRVVVERVYPKLDGGRYPVKRTVGEQLTVQADIFADGHDAIQAVVRFRKVSDKDWWEVPMLLLGNDRWAGTFRITEEVPYLYTVAAWIDRFGSWKHMLAKKLAARQALRSELLEGAALVEAAALRAGQNEKDWLRVQAEKLQDNSESEAVAAALDDRLQEVMLRYQRRDDRSEASPPLMVWVDRPRARFSAWYELFPRSAGTSAERSATFTEAEARLADIAGLGFDVIYLPPIHPIGQSNRKGKDNSLEAGPTDPGSPWAIGSNTGGHKAVHPELGTLGAFRRFVAHAREVGLEVALDIAFQCSPDHPYVREHPDWFYRRPDGSIHYAENPPKKYQDIYPLNFECEDWQALWQELLSVFLHWVEQGVRIFRVDNPHTKPFSFWEWVIREVHAIDPGVIFLSEAFTRPKRMANLAKLGFTQSYTYFTWRTTKQELAEYLTELTQGEQSEFFRPNFFTNTPDILPLGLQTGGPGAFKIRLVLAATLSSNYGIYSGFELCESEAVPGKEEYLHSEKYEIRSRNWRAPGNIRPLVSQVNALRREYRALQYTNNLLFCDIDSTEMLAYLKLDPANERHLLIVVTLHPFQSREATITVPLDRLGLRRHDSLNLWDRLSDQTFLWHGPHNYVRLDPMLPAHIMEVTR
ncbi:MAG: alpha-1,4-glucan--maltose-1-phosphate maltosyltransferase [Bdellovibrionales bacterium]|nr:alpha-1,4-glucan--maltose-1-phosphate maltosyltransferase [Bdellovibrionales bacterium]